MDSLRRCLKGSQKLHCQSKKNFQNFHRPGATPRREGMLSMNKYYRKPFSLIFMVTLIVISCAANVSSQGHTCPMMQQHQDHKDHHANVNERGDKAMGFAHEKTTHHFTL